MVLILKFVTFPMIKDRFEEMPCFFVMLSTTPYKSLQDFIPPEELAKLAAKSGDKASAEALEKQNAIGAICIKNIFVSWIQKIQKLDWPSLGCMKLLQFHD